MGCNELKSSKTLICDIISPYNFYFIRKITFENLLKTLNYNNNIEEKQMTFDEWKLIVEEKIILKISETNIISSENNLNIIENVDYTSIQKEFLLNLYRISENLHPFCIVETIIFLLFPFINNNNHDFSDIKITDNDEKRIEVNDRLISYGDRFFDDDSRVIRNFYFICRKLLLHNNLSNKFTYKELIKILSYYITYMSKGIFELFKLNITKIYNDEVNKDGLLSRIGIKVNNQLNIKEYDFDKYVNEVLNTMHVKSYFYESFANLFKENNEQYNSNSFEKNYDQDLLEEDFTNIFSNKKHLFTYESFLNEFDCFVNNYQCNKSNKV